MFLSSVVGRYWVELIDQATADWESFRMDHAVSKYFAKHVTDRRSVPKGDFAEARFFSLRNRNADPVATAMTQPRRIDIDIGTRFVHKHLLEVCPQGERVHFADFVFGGKRHVAKRPGRSNEACFLHFQFLKSLLSNNVQERDMSQRTRMPRRIKAKRL